VKLLLEKGAGHESKIEVAERRCQAIIQKESSFIWIKVFSH
jgi:hypothetical protein